MTNQIIPKAKPKTVLWWLGVWATVWLGISGIFLVILFWKARLFYVYNAPIYPSSSFISLWHKALSHAYSNSKWLQGFSVFILCVWLIGGFVWLKELKTRKIPYADALKDLFLNIRK